MTLMVNQYKKTCQFKTWCKGDKSNIENSTDHFCEDTRQNALAAVTNLGHVTPFLLLGPPRHLTIQWVREITSLDSKLPDQTEVHIRTDLGTDPLAERNRSHSSIIRFQRILMCCRKLRFQGRSHVKVPQFCKFNMADGSHNENRCSAISGRFIV